MIITVIAVFLFLLIPLESEGDHYYMKSVDNHFGMAVKSARQSMSITQMQLAEKLCITPRYLKAIENSGRKPSYDLLVRIVRELEIPTDSVFYPEYENEKSAVKMFSLRRAL